MKCPKKNSYPTEGAAYYAMRKIPARATGQVPFRIYWCAEHGAYHYSSKAQHKRRK